MSKLKIVIICLICLITLGCNNYSKKEELVNYVKDNKSVDIIERLDKSIIEISNRQEPFHMIRVCLMIYCHNYNDFKFQVTSSTQKILLCFSTRGSEFFDYSVIRTPSRSCLCFSHNVSFRRSGLICSRLFFCSEQPYPGYTPF